MNDNEFVEKVKGEIGEIRENLAKENLGDCFAVWFCNKILGFDLDESNEIFHIGSKDDDKLDLGIINEDLDCVIIAQCKFPHKKKDDTFEINYNSEANKDLIDEILTAENRIHTSPNTGNDKRKKFVQEFKSSKKPLLKLAVSFSKISNPNVWEYAYNNNVVVYDFEKIKNRCSFTDSFILPEEPKTINLILDEKHLKPLEYSSDQLECKIYLIKLNEIFKNVKKWKNGLFSENIRYKLETPNSLSIRKDINKTIQETPDKFGILNNGLVIVADSVTQAGNKITLANPQIVNGCQTSFAIYDTMTDLERLNDPAKKPENINALVLVKIIKTSPKVSTDEITTAANNQNAVTIKDRRGNDDLQKKIQVQFEQYSARVFYSRKPSASDWSTVVQRNAQDRFKVSKHKKFRILDKEFCGQLYLALMGLPYYSKNEKRKIFEDMDFYHTIFDYENRNFSELQDNSKLIRLENGLENFVKDVIFGYEVFTLAKALEYSFKQKIKLFETQLNAKDLEKNNFYINLKSKDFLTSWHYYLVFIVHYLIEDLLTREESDRDTLRKRITGELPLDVFFTTAKKIAINNFAVDIELNTHSIIRESEDANLSLFSKWYTKIEEIIWNVINKAREDAGVDWKDSAAYLDKSGKPPLDKIMGEIDRVLGGPQRKTIFPMALK